MHTTLYNICFLLNSRKPFKFFHHVKPFHKVLNVSPSLNNQAVVHFLKETKYFFTWLEVSKLFAHAGTFGSTIPDIRFLMVWILSSVIGIESRVFESSAQTRALSATSSVLCLKLKFKSVVRSIYSKKFFKSRNVDIRTPTTLRYKKLDKFRVNRYKLLFNLLYFHTLAWIWSEHSFFPKLLSETWEHDSSEKLRL